MCFLGQKYLFKQNPTQVLLTFSKSILFVLPTTSAQCVSSIFNFFLNKHTGGNYGSESNSRSGSVSSSSNVSNSNVEGGENSNKETKGEGGEGEGDFGGDTVDTSYRVQQRYVTGDYFGEEGMSNISKNFKKFLHIYNTNLFNFFLDLNFFSFSKNIFFIPSRCIKFKS